MADYSVLIEVRAHAAPDLDVDAAIADLLDRLDAGGYAPSVSGNADTWSARILITAADAIEATVSAWPVVIDAAAGFGLPTKPIARAEAVREDVLDEDLARPQLPDLVDAVEVGEMLNVSPQRVRTLAATHPDFPAAFIDRPHAKLWVRAAVAQFAENWHRKPGRQPKGSAA
jgi:hypothetical protein